MISNVPWQRDLGAARGQIELADEVRRLGHTVAKFDSRDAFGDERPARWHRLFPLRFATRARKYILEHGRDFDVIEALEGDLPFTKRELGFEGRLVASSCGLHALYAEYIHYERSTWPGRIPGSAAGKALYRWSVKQTALACRRSLETADLIKVLNEDEEAYVRDVLGLGAKCVRLPYGLADGFADALARAALPAEARLRRREIVFTGAWCLRKGAADWPQIIDRTRSIVPDASFRFLGTWRERAEVLKDLGLPNAEWVSVVPRFDPSQLPKLLATATVGALPSYVEGFGLGVLEQLGARLPTVTYDVPGPRVMLRRLTRVLMAPAGDTARFAELLAEILRLGQESYDELSTRCASVAREFRWPQIAQASCDAYAAASPTSEIGVPAYGRA
jgi:glycosyltransferase involved in cell wall biosynthesis